MNTTDSTVREIETRKDAAGLDGEADVPDNSRYETITLEMLRSEEWRHIAARRVAAKVATKDDSEKPPHDLVGLSLSGGGVRSSMFSTGVLQGLHKIGLLKHVDYLATVSGGGFIGGFLTSQYQEQERRKKKKGKAQSLDELFPLKQDGEGQNSAVNQLTKSGGYLSGPTELTLRVATGVVLHLLIIASVLVMTCSAASLFWRLFDMTLIQRALSAWATWLDRHSGWGYAWCGIVLSLLYLAYYSPHLWNARTDNGERLRRLTRKLATWAILVGGSLSFVYYEGGFFAIYHDWFALSDLARALIPLGFFACLFGFVGQIHKAALRAQKHSGGRHLDPGTSWTAWLLGWTARLLRLKGRLLVISLLLTILTLLANGDTDLGPRVGEALGRLFPSLGRETTTSQVSLQVRNDQSIRQWLTTITQYLLFIQLSSGIIPLLLPRQFASSGHADASGFSRGVYRGILFLLFISLPLVICFIFLRENISGAVETPSPIRRLAVSRDPVTGKYGYLIEHDQWTRLRWLIAGALGFVALNVHVDLNRTSLHRYYRRRLKSAYFDAFPSRDFDPHEPDGLKETLLREIRVDQTGAPYPLFVATLNEIRPGTTSLDSGCAFIFSSRYCGWSRNQPIGPLRSSNRPNSGATDPPEHQSCFIQTEAYGAPDPNDPDGREPGLRLVDAMAISGAAITPSNSQSVLDTILLLAANARLGQWLVNPEAGTNDDQSPNDEESLARRQKIFHRLLGRRGHGIPSISVWRLFRSLWKSPDGGRDFCFLSDGAHYDNLGMETLFERRCRLIIASDASHDPHYEFRDLSKTLRRLRAFWGIEFFLDRKPVEEFFKAKAEEKYKDEAKAKEEAKAKADRLVPKNLLGPKNFARNDGDGAKRAAETSLCQSRYLVFAFRYPKKAVADENQRWGLLVVLKPSLNGREDRESAGLFSFARSQKTFPMDDDMNQFFDENQCEYYRELGSLVAASILDRKTDDAHLSLDDILDRIHKPVDDNGESSPRPSASKETPESGALEVIDVVA